MATMCEKPDTTIGCLMDKKEECAGMMKVMAQGAGTSEDGMVDILGVNLG